MSVLELSPGAKIIGWARDLSNGKIERGCGETRPPTKSDIDFVFIPKAEPDDLGNKTDIIKFYGHIKINADGSRENTGCPFLRNFGNFTGIRRSNFAINNYSWFAAIGIQDPNCKKIFQEHFSTSYFTSGTPQNNEVLEIRRINNFDYP